MLELENDDLYAEQAALIKRLHTENKKLRHNNLELYAICIKEHDALLEAEELLRKIRMELADFKNMVR